MACVPDCGLCCDPVKLVPEHVQRVFMDLEDSREAQWIRDHLAAREATEGGVAFDCVNYNVETRACEAWLQRPPMCRDYPFYGEWPSDTVVMDVCGYQADVGRTVLPLIAIT